MRGNVDYAYNYHSTIISFPRSHGRISDDHSNMVLKSFKRFWKNYLDEGNEVGPIEDWGWQIYEQNFTKNDYFSSYEEALREEWKWRDKYHGVKNGVKCKTVSWDYDAKEEEKKAKEEESKAKQKAFNSKYSDYIVSAALTKDNLQKIQYYSSAIGMNPNNPQAYNLRYEPRIHLGQYELAVADIKKVFELSDDVTLSPKNKSELYGALGVCLQNLNNYKEAIDNFNEAISFNAHPNSWMLYLNRAMAKGSLKLNIDAIKDFELALNLANNSFQKATIYFQSGVFYEEIKNFSKALNCYEKALEYSPNSSDIKNFIERVINKDNP